MDVHPQVVQHWLVIGTSIAGATGIAVLAGIAIARHRRPTREQIEERRRKRLATSGRIVDGSLIDAEPVDDQPKTIMYTYRIAGVSYECSQDVSTLSEMVENLRLDRPVQVRYCRDNPADSIVVAETWNGLRKTVESNSRHLRAVEDSSRPLETVQNS